MNVTVFNMKREFAFNGPRKVGLDSGVLIDLIDNISFFAEQHLKIFEKKDLFFTHRWCVSETISKLIEKKGQTKEDAEKNVHEFLKKNNISIIEKDFSNIALLNEMKQMCNEKKIEFHPPDSYIIADFKKNGINKIYSTNNHFLDACKLFGMDASKFPTFDKELSRKLGEFFKSRRK